MMVVEGGPIFVACFYIFILPLVFPRGDAERQVMFAEEMMPFWRWEICCARHSKGSLQMLSRPGKPGEKALLLQNITLYP